MSEQASQAHWCNRCYGMTDHLTSGHPREAYTMHDFIESAFVVDCSRCANEGTAYEQTQGQAEDFFTGLGWTLEGPRLFCPACSGEIKSGARSER